MKKILLTAVLIGGTMFAANAGDFVLNLPGLFLKVGDCHQKVFHPKPQHHVIIHHHPAPPKRFHTPPPKPHHKQHGHHKPKHGRR
jgi:hypothetical protein